LCVGKIAVKPARFCVRSHWRLAHHAHTRALFSILLSTYFSPRASIQGTALKPNFIIIANNASVQGEISKTMRKVANDPLGTRIRRVAISNSDPHGADAHWFAVSVETGKPLELIHDSASKTLLLYQDYNSMLVVFARVHFFLQHWLLCHLGLY
jgi:hypothetical protein